MDLLVNIDSHERYRRPTFYESRGNEDYGDVFTIKIRALTRSRSTKTWIKPNIDENPIWRRFFRRCRWLLKSPRLQEFYFYGKRMLYGWFYPNMNMLNKSLPTKIMWHAHFAWHFGPEWALFSNYYLSLKLSNGYPISTQSCQVWMQFKPNFQLDTYITTANPFWVIAL